jgi:hypothetical protein
MSHNIRAALIYGSVREGRFCDTVQVDGDDAGAAALVGQRPVRGAPGGAVRRGGLRSAPLP